jgi:hypothetical protein
MKHYERLREDERNQRLTVSHAIDVLANDADFGDDDFAEIQVGILPLPSQEIVGLTNVFFDSRALGKMLVVSLATSAGFWAIRQGEVEACWFSIFELDGAKVDNGGLVRLSGGAIVRAVTVIPAKLPLKPSELDFRIVHHVISIIGAQDRCYRSLREHAKPSCPDVVEEMIPAIQFIDCSTLKGLKLPSLKSIAQRIGQMDPALKRLSRQKIADALLKFGMRIPTSQLRS